MQKRFCSLQEGSVVFSISAIKLKTMAQKGLIPATKTEDRGRGKWLIDIEAMTAQLRANIAKTPEEKK